MASLPPKDDRVTKQADLKLDTNPKLVTKATEILEPLANTTVEQNLEHVLDAVKTVDQTCDYKRCKQKTTMMGSDCGFCKQRFCFKHGLPEIHGCGEAVRKVEREAFLHPLPAKTVQAQEDLKKAQGRLDQKLKQMNLNRKAKPPGAGTSKRKGKS
ncbi:DNA-binding protein SMUBP-2 [Toxorhynchites rutilus septentrionalis]|uniref:DNA-binding protein SMUBP-2 n=1 Tax=Toxorhynchites rutilus septentrionalis TaxID=329112 RepID=UPI002479CC8C|nr:DNA-binding protein SMUBP-2 [Toxorhynchites rutilus septentrionalis]